MYVYVLFNFPNQMIIDHVQYHSHAPLILQSSQFLI